MTLKLQNDPPASALSARPTDMLFFFFYVFVCLLRGFHSVQDGLQPATFSRLCLLLRL